MKQLLDNKIQREFFAFVDTIDGTPTFCGFSNSITQGTITNIVYFAVELKLRERRRNFYQRNGFEASPFDYLWQGEHYRLLTVGGTVTEKEFRDFWKEVLKVIPGAKYP